MNTVQEIEDIMTFLIRFEIQIIESMQELKNLEMLGMTTTEAYLEECEKIRVYSKKENMLLEKIKCLPCEFEKHTQDVIINLENYAANLDEEQRTKLLNRLIEIFGHKCKELVKENDDPETEDEYEDTLVFYEDEYGLDDIGEQITLQNDIIQIKKIQDFIDREDDETEKEELIDYKFNLVSQSKIMTDQMLEVGMNPYFLFENPEDVVIKELETDEEKFQTRKKEKIILMIDSLIDIKIKKAANVEQTLMDNIDLAVIKEVLDTLTTPDLTELLTKYCDESKKSNNSNYKIIIEILKHVLNKRKDYIAPSSKLHENQMCNAIPKEVLDSFISLIKLAELIVQKHKELCKLEKVDLKNTIEYQTTLKTLASYLEFEKEGLSTFEFDSSIGETLEDILNYHLDILLQNKDNTKAVRKRISNMIPELNPDFASIAGDNEIAYSIHQNFYLKTIKKLDTIIQKTKNKKLKKKLIDEKYRQSSYHQCIGDDMISTAFTPVQAFIFDEETQIEVLGISDYEYGFDKNEEFYVLGNMIIYDMINNRMNDGEVIYSKICLMEILDNINYENLYGLEEQYNQQIATTGKRSKKSMKKLQLQPLFKKRKPNYQ